MNPLRPDPRQSPQEVLRALKDGSLIAHFKEITRAFKIIEPRLPLRVREATPHEHWQAGGRAPGIDSREIEG